MEPPTPHPPIGQVPSAVPPPRAGTATVPPPPLPTPAVPAPAAKRRLWPVLAIAVSTLALLLAGGAGLVSWRALDQANDARDIALRGGQPPVAQPAGETPPTAYPRRPRCPLRHKWPCRRRSTRLPARRPTTCR